MLKRIIIVLSILICVTLIVIMTQNNKKIAMASWNEKYATLDEVYYNSDVIFVGKVKALNPYKLYEMIFTNVEVEVIDTLKGTTNKIVNVKYTGGKLGNQEIELDQSKIPSLNDTYIFFTSQDKESIYVPISYQGTFKLSKNKVVGFNKENEIEKLLLGKNVNSINTEAKDVIKNRSLSELEKPMLNVYYLSDALVKCAFMDTDTLKVEKAYWGALKENDVIELNNKYVGKKILEKKEFLESEDKFILDYSEQEIILALKYNNDGTYSVMYGNNGVYKYNKATNEYLNFRGYVLTEEYIQILKLDWEKSRSN